MFEVMTAMDADFSKLPQWVQIWIDILVAGSLLCIVVLLFSATTRKIALISLALFVLGAAGVTVLYSQMGLVRLLGLGHVIFWTPLLYLLVGRIRNNPPSGVFRLAIVALTVIIAIALVFDYLDVLRWLLGERGTII